MTEADHHHDRTHEQSHHRLPPAAETPAPMAATEGAVPWVAVTRLMSDVRLAGRGNGPVRVAQIQRMQQTAGNRATRRVIQRQVVAVQRHNSQREDESLPLQPMRPATPAMVQRHDSQRQDESLPLQPLRAAADLPIQRNKNKKKPVVYPTVTLKSGLPPMTRAEQEAKARFTLGRIPGLLKRMQAKSRPEAFRGAGRMYAKGQITYDVLTLRSDSQLTAQAVDFFLGAVENNTVTDVPGLGGQTIPQSRHVKVVGHKLSGEPTSDENLMDVLAHEASHVAVFQYGEGGAAGTWENYKDEFRAYWLQQDSDWSQDPPSAKWKKIRDHVIKNYPYIKDSYQKDAGFKLKVDAYKAPSGFNVTMNTNLDLLYTKLKAQANFAEILKLVDKTMNSSERRRASADPKIQDTITQVVKNGTAAAMLRDFMAERKGWWGRLGSRISGLSEDAYSRGSADPEPVEVVVVDDDAEAIKAIKNENVRTLFQAIYRDQPITVPTKVGALSGSDIADAKTELVKHAKVGERIEAWRGASVSTASGKNKRAAAKAVDDALS